MTSATILSGTKAANGSARRGRSNGAESRDRILANAGRLFAQRGYNGVSMRDLARAAKVNLGAINYHFGGKAALYHETILRLIEDIGPLFGPLLVRLKSEVAAAGDDREVLAVAAARFFDGMFKAVLGTRKMRWQMAFLLREFHQPSREFSILLKERIDPMHDAVGSLVAAALGGDPASPEIRIRVEALIGQVMSLGAVRVVVCARLGWTDYTPENIAFIARSLIPVMLRSLELPAVDPAEIEEAESCGSC